ncbi:MAG: hypothetical protein H6713_13650 [Myxococcales bacterium]|nr:hypothetical protein [Myxococcales bacterium]MCB9751028.1 hypothetical protein [Myxococcales bacterium]
MTLSELFPGNMGRVELTRVAVRLRLPTLLTMRVDEHVEPALETRLRQALVEVRRG